MSSNRNITFLNMQLNSNFDRLRGLVGICIGKLLWFVIWNWNRHHRFNFTLTSQGSPPYRLCQYEPIMVLFVEINKFLGNLTIRYSEQYMNKNELNADIGFIWFRRFYYEKCSFYLSIKYRGWMKVMVCTHYYIK